MISAHEEKRRIIMKEYIEREAIEKIIGEIISKGGTEAEILTEVHFFPAADVAEVRHGRWHDVYLSSASSFVGICSICGESNDIPPVPLAKFCPFCGAKMDGEQNDGQ